MVQGTPGTPKLPSILSDDSSLAQRALSMKQDLALAVQKMESELQGQASTEHLRLLSILGTGGFATVYHGVWPLLLELRQFGGTAHIR